MEMKGLMGGFYRISEWIMRFSVTNILWVFCSLPVFFILFIIYTQPIEIEQALGLLLPVIILSPFTLFPATAAMFALARKWIMGDADVPLFKTFFRSYKENYLQSMLGGIVFALLVFVFRLNFKFYSELDSNFSVVSVFFLAFGIVLFIAVFNFFSILVHLHMSTLQVLKNAILITIGRPFTSIMMAVTNLFILYVSILVPRFSFLIPFFMGSLIAYMSFFHFYRVFEKIKMKQEQHETEAELEEASQKSAK